MILVQFNLIMQSRQHKYGTLRNFFKSKVKVELRCVVFGYNYGTFSTFESSQSSCHLHESLSQRLPSVFQQATCIVRVRIETNERPCQRRGRQSARHAISSLRRRRREAYSGYRPRTAISSIKLLASPLRPVAITRLSSRSRRAIE